MSELQQRRLAAIMFTDIAGYTALMGKNEDMAFEILRKNREIHNRCIGQFNGTLIKEMGDGILASFHSSSDAVRCAFKIQEESKKQDIPLKIGIHEGEMVFEGDDVLGDGVNVASRLESITEKGTITISEAIYRNVKNKPGIYTAFLYEKSLKNVDEPVKIYQVSDEVIPDSVSAKKQPEKINKRKKVLYYSLPSLFIIVMIILLWKFIPWSSINREPDKKYDENSIAVIPFWNDSPDPDNEYFCTGMEEEIRVQLAKISELNVASRQSVEKFRESAEHDIKIIGKELGVAYIVEGSVRKEGDNIRITIQLIDSYNGSHLWAENYDEKLSPNLFTYQSNTARKIAASLHVAITPAEARRINKIPTTNMQAYNLRIMAGHLTMKYFRTHDRKLLEEARDLLRQAIDLDPVYLSATLGKTNLLLAEEKYDSALMFADKVLEVDSEYVEALWCKANCYIQLEKDELAIEQWENIMKLTRNINPWLYIEIGKIYADQKLGAVLALKNYEEGLKRMTLIEPPLGVYNHIGRCFLNIGDYEKAEEYHQMTYPQDPENCETIEGYLAILLMQRKFQDLHLLLDSISRKKICMEDFLHFKMWAHFLNKEFDLFNEYYQRYKDEGLHYVSVETQKLYVDLKTGKEEATKENLKISTQYLKEHAEDLFIKKNAYANAQVFYMAGDIKTALKYLQEAVDAGMTWGLQDIIEYDPIFENLRDDSEFKSIVKQVKDEKAMVRGLVRDMIDRGEINL